MASHAAAGSLALDSKEYSAAVKHYTAALSDTPTSPVYLIKRSTAYQRSSPAQYDEALRDADAAVHYALARGKKELIASAQMRRGIALFGLRRFADAGQCLEWAKKRHEKEQGLGLWEKKVQVELDKAKANGVSEEVTVVEIPTPEARPSNPDGENTTLAKNGTKAAQAATSQIAEGVQTPANKIRHEWYQTSDKIVVTLFAKGVPKDKALVDIQEQAVSISFPMPSSSSFEFSLDPLYATVDPAKSTYSVMSTKLELILEKSTPGRKWPSLEGSEIAQTQDKSTDNSNVGGAKASSSNLERDAAPSYPTSSRSGPKDWDKVAADLSKKPARAEAQGDSGGEPAEGDDLDDDEGDPVNGFFKKLYAGADPDTRRAMMKSYQESNGTALSTNWSEVGSGPVATSPPDGMEAKKWEK
ncbi:MAG: hypothetical protein M1833_001818 [Piccolia ochrophora]|nr:MAG: hypothetical protein M1833_001818 [Piccolia ochrophora]